jgi:DNA repair exonuclease SbcCD nuclease subunit
MKILIFSDIHIHPHKKSVERLEDCIKVLDWVFSCAKENNVRDIIFLGDLFHDRQKIDVLTYQKTFEILEKHLINNKLNLFLLLGNHDLWHNQKWDVSSVNPLRNLPGVSVINEPCVRSLSDEYLFGFLPYTHDPISDIQKIEKQWKNECKDKNINPPKLLGGHIAVDGALWNVKYGTTAEVAIEHDGDMVKVGPGIFDNWDRVFLGHYHAEQQLSENVQYVGSPLQLSFGEAFQDKHVIIYDINKDDRSYVKNEFSPKHYIIKEDELDDYNLEGNFIRLEVKDISSSSMAEVRKNLIDNKKVATMEIKQSVKKEEHNITDAKSILYKEEEMLEKYVEQVNLDLEKEKLISIGKLICNCQEK